MNIKVRLRKADLSAAAVEQALFNILLTVNTIDLVRSQRIVNPDAPIKQ
jgi:hypothetical protein